jgi:acetyltransferase-like isoleucine patch superfamily enzyme
MIEAKSIHIGERVTFGNVDIKINGEFYIGNDSHLGDCEIRGNNIHFGSHLYVSKGLRVGGGGHEGPDANLWVGNRCVMHNNFINVCEPVVIGDDVGLSQEVSIITHGFWQSVLEGFPAKFEPVTIMDGVIVGYRSTILPGSHIEKDVVVGAGSVVTGYLESGIYAGVPAKHIGDFKEMTDDDKRNAIDKIMAKYARLCQFKEMMSDIRVNYPIVEVNGFFVNVESLKWWGTESRESDHFRDFIRKFGLRIYTERRFG